MATVALLDEDGVLTGYRRCRKSEWKTGNGAVAVPDGCDLAPGRYRWDGDTFMPLPPDGSQEAVAPDFIAAFTAALMKLSEDHDLPEVTLDWLEYYPKTFDGKGFTWKRPKP